LAREVAGGDARFLDKLLTTFLADATARLEAMDGALSNDNNAEAMRLLHSLKGSTASLGASRVAGRAAHAEEMLRQGQSENGKRAIDEFREELAGLIRCIRAEIDGEVERHENSPG